MKTNLFSIVAFFLVMPMIVCAQNSPVEHMQYFNEQEEALSKKTLSYMSEVAHGHRARKMEKRREDVINSVRLAIRETGKLKPYNGDASLRDAYKQYFSLLLSVLTEDYSKIIDMEEIAERSYDAMEAYLLIQEKADEKMDEAYETVKVSYRAFAAKNNVTLTESQGSKLSRRVMKAGKVNSYQNQVFLIFFKSNVQEMLMIEGVNAKDINAIEQCRNTLLKFSIEGLSRLDTLKPFEGDGSLITACRKVLEFQRNEAQNKVKGYTDFIMKEEEFAKLRKGFESMTASSRTKGDIDSYNKSVTDFNKALADYNKMNQELNNSRTGVMTNWETTRKRFLDHHVPHKL